MSIQISISGAEADRELASLYTWLREEPDVRLHARIMLKAGGPRPGELGAAFDIIQLVVDSGFQALNLALAFAAWRTTRPSHPAVTIESEGTKVTLEEADPDTVETIVRALR